MVQYILPKADSAVNNSVQVHVLFCEKIAVTVTVHEDEYGRKTVPLQPIASPEEVISIAECSPLGNVLNKIMLVRPWRLE